MANRGGEKSCQDDSLVHPCSRKQGKAQRMQGYMLRGKQDIPRGRDKLNKSLLCLNRDRHEQGRNRTNLTSNCKKGVSLIAICIANKGCPLLLYSIQLAKLSISPSRTGSHVSIPEKTSPSDSTNIFHSTIVLSTFDWEQVNRGISNDSRGIRGGYVGKS